MIPREEREEIINEAIERFLRMAPEVLGNLMKTHSMYAQLNKKFYDEHPDFVAHKDIVAQTIGRVEGENPLLQYAQILAKALPEIQRNIQLASKLDFKIKPLSEVNRNFDISNNGEL